MHFFFFYCHSLLDNNFKCLTLILTWGSTRVKNPKTPCKIYTQQPVVNNGVVTYWQRRDGFARGFHGEASVFHSSFTPPRSAPSHRRSPLSRPPLCGSGAGLRGTAPASAAFTARRTRGERSPRGWKWEVVLLRGTHSVKGRGKEPSVRFFCW